MEIPDGFEIPCQFLDISGLQPTGSLVDPEMYETVSLTEWDFCGFEFDTDRNGVVNAWDEVGDMVSLTGGLVGSAGGLQADMSKLNDIDAWAARCIGERERINPPVPADWTRAVACQEGGAIKELHLVLVAHTSSGLPATLLCSVSAPTGNLAGREIGVEQLCNSWKRGLYGGD